MQLPLILFKWSSKFLLIYTEVSKPSLRVQVRLSFDNFPCTLNDEHSNICCVINNIIQSQEKREKKLIQRIIQHSTSHNGGSKVVFQLLWLHFSNFDADVCRSKCKAGYGNTSNLRKYLDNQTLVKVECTTSDSMNVKFTEGLKAKFCTYLRMMVMMKLLERQRQFPILQRDKLSQELDCLLLVNVLT